MYLCVRGISKKWKIYISKVNLEDPNYKFLITEFGKQTTFFLLVIYLIKILRRQPQMLTGSSMKVMILNKFRFVFLVIRQLFSKNRSKLFAKK